MATSPEVLASFLAPPILRRFVRDPAPLDGPEAERFPAALLAADISGFTVLTEHLTEHSLPGVEQLSAILNQYFEPVIALITAHGGEIIKFAGDSLLVGWPSGGDGDLRSATRRAAQCALAVQNSPDNYDASSQTRLLLRVGIGAGDAVAMHVGGTFGRWEFLLGGSPLHQIGTALRLGGPGDVVVSPEAWALLADVGGAAPLDHGCWHLTTIYAPLPARPAAVPAVPMAAEAMLQRYIPAAIRERLAAGQDDWIGELRTLTVIFLNVLGLDDTAPTVLEQMQAAMLALQAAIYRFEGSVNKLTLDDKGVTLLAALGLPPLAHEDNAVRGVRAALAMQKSLRELGLSSAIGISTGRVFCGAIGSAIRREYTIVGSKVNLAARMMQVAQDTILCDRVTFQSAQRRIEFTSLSTIAVKGMAEPVEVFRPEGPSRAMPNVRALIGRSAERALLVDRLRGLLAGESGVVLVEGEAGIGKSRLVEDFVEQARSLGIVTLVGTGDAIERSTPYHAWSSVFAAVLGVADALDLDAQRKGVLGQLAAHSGLVPLAPLLNAVLPLGLPDNDHTAQLSGDARAAYTRELLTGILRVGATRDRTVLVVHDAHWLDSSSWALLLEVSRSVQPLLVVISSRPPAELYHPDYRRLLEIPEILHVRLKGLPSEETLALVSQRLGIDVLPEPVSSLIQEKAQGNPFFSEELAFAMRDAGWIQIVDGQCSIATQAGDPRLLGLPDTVQGVIISRIDRLPAAHQLALKVASVVGRVFSLQVVRGIHPVEADKPRLPTYFQTLTQLDLTVAEPGVSDPSYIFKHVITQEVAYNMMLYGQRRDLHRAVAEWYERSLSADLSRHAPLLAHHWTEAGVASKAIDYFEQSGEQALRSGAWQEAIDFLGRALQYGGKTAASIGDPTSPGRPDDNGIAVPPLRRVRWELQRAEAQIGLAKYRESRQSLERATVLLNLPVPAIRGRLVVGIIREILGQAVHRTWPKRFLGRVHQEQLARYQEASRTYRRLGTIYFVASQPIYCLYASLMGLNLAEAAGSRVEMAQMYASLSVAAGLVPLHSVARMYARLARETAREVNDAVTHAWVLQLGGIYAVGTGQWTEARTQLTDGISTWERLRDYHRADECRALIATAYACQADFARGLQYWEEATVGPNQRGEVNPNAVWWGMTHQAENLVALGRLDDAIARLEVVTEAEVRNPRSVEGQILVVAHGILALAFLRRGEPARAREAVDRAFHFLARTTPTAVYTYAGYASTALVYLALWEGSLARPDGQQRVLIERARQSCDRLRKFARVFPIAKPRSSLCQGLRDWLEGHPGAARRAWEQSEETAEKLGMPYERGLALLEIGRHIGDGDSRRSECLERACRIFAQVGATADRDRTLALITASRSTQSTY